MISTLKRGRRKSQTRPSQTRKRVSFVPLEEVAGERGFVPLALAVLKRLRAGYSSKRVANALSKVVDLRPPAVQPNGDAKSNYNFLTEVSLLARLARLPAKVRNAFDSNRLKLAVIPEIAKERDPNKMVIKIHNMANHTSYVPNIGAKKGSELSSFSHLASFGIDGDGEVSDTGSSLDKVRR